MILKATDLRVGSKIELAGDVYVVTDFMHITPGKGRAVVRTKLKDYSTGRVIERTFDSGEKIRQAQLQLRPMQFLYRQGDLFVFMDLESFEQLTLDESHLGDATSYLIENLELSVALHKGKPIGVELPPKVALRVSETEPGIKGDTVSSPSKPAVMETGLVVQVPLFIKEGDVIKIDTRDGKYEERV